VASATQSNTSSWQSASVKILANGEHFDRTHQHEANTERFQAALDAARNKFGHALCLCRPTPLKLQIRLRDAKYHLAVWPEQGPMHDSDCVFFREEQSGPVGEIKSRIVKNDDGTESIHLTFALDRSTQAHIPRPQPGAIPKASNQAHSDHIPLRGLLNLLWFEASLTRWHPTWKRDWGRTRYELLQAANRIKVDSVALGERLFVPRPFRDAMKDDINREWDRFCSGLKQGNGTTIKGGLLIAPARQLTEHTNHEGIRRSATLQLRHMITPIGMSEATYAFLSAQCKPAVRRIQLNAQKQEPPPPNWVQLPQPEIIAILHVEAGARGGIWARAAWLMSVHPRVFIPAGNLDDILLIDALMRDGHQFSRLLSMHQPMARSEPEWIARHVYDPNGVPVPRVALEILSNGAMPDFLARRRALANELASRGIPLWRWTPSGRQVERTAPPIPPNELTPKEAALAALQAIAGSPGVTYSYGLRDNE
jgi:hypothetical protein